MYLENFSLSLSVAIGAGVPETTADRGHILKGLLRRSETGRLLQARARCWRLALDVHCWSWISCSWFCWRSEGRLSNLVAHTLLRLHHHASCLNVVHWQRVLHSKHERKHKGNPCAAVTVSPDRSGSRVRRSRHHHVCFTRQRCWQLHRQCSCLAGRSHMFNWAQLHRFLDDSYHEQPWQFPSCSEYRVR